MGQGMQPKRLRFDLDSIAAAAEFGYFDFIGQGFGNSGVSGFWNPIARHASEPSSAPRLKQLRVAVRVQAVTSRPCEVGADD